jgi:hypothetical protein
MLCMAAVIFSSGSALAVLPDKRGPTDIVTEENSPETVELHRVRFVNSVNGPIEVSRDGGKTWTRIGNVMLTAGTVNPNGYTASGWAPVGRVAATAVNAVHIKVAQNNAVGVTLSLMPKEFFTPPPPDYASYFARSASIITDIPAGTGFFGGAESPFVGNKVLLERNGGAPAPIAEDYVPADGDAIIVVVERPVKYPVEIEFENRFGGFVTVRYPGGESKLIGEVLKPVAGVGRFEGSVYADVGRLRANHTGVVCVSTSPVGEIGGFQILPDNHGMSQEMFRARLLTQWMVVGPPSVTDPSLEGVAPLFRYFMRPVYYKIGTTGRSLDEMLGAFIVQVRINGGDWERMPTVTGRVDDALKDVTAIRILFPLEWRD